MLLLLPLAVSGCRVAGHWIYKPWLHMDRIRTEDFDSVRSAIQPDVEELFGRAERKFARGSYVYQYPSDRRMESAHEKYGVYTLHIVRFEGEGTTYEVLFVYTLHSRTAAGGYYYTPSGRLPPWAPAYGVVCSRNLGDGWYALNTIDSENPPSEDICPEDTQYR